MKKAMRHTLAEGRARRKLVIHMKGVIIPAKPRERCYIVRCNRPAEDIFVAGKEVFEPVRGDWMRHTYFLFRTWNALAGHDE